MKKRTGKVTPDRETCELCVRGVEHTIRAHLNSIKATRDLWRAIRQQRGQVEGRRPRAAAILRGLAS